MGQNNRELLIRLRKHEVEFVIIDGVCCVYYGVPLATFDLDICCPFDEATLRRIEAAVMDLHPIHRLAANKLPLVLTSELASRLKNLYLQTDVGKLDCLGEVAGVGNYQDAVKHSRLHKFEYGDFRFLSIDNLMLAKKASDRDRDRQALRYLEAIKEKMLKDPGTSVPDPKI
jgi:hypothetical protein